MTSRRSRVDQTKSMQAVFKPEVLHFKEANRRKRAFTITQAIVESDQFELLK